MKWMVFVVGAVLSWGLYGVTLHRGQVLLGNPLRALLCVGVAYMAIGIVIPLVVLAAQGELSLSGFGLSGVTLSTLAGAFGALGAVCVIWAFRSGGLPIYVMPLIFAGAPVVNALVSALTHPSRAAHPLLYVGFVMAAGGAFLVLRYRP